MDDNFSAPRDIGPTARDASPCMLQFDGRVADETYLFLDESGQVVFAELQWRPKGKKKEVRPAEYSASGWRPGAPPAPRPLFNLDKIVARADAQVYLFEGPRKAAKAADCFPEAVCSAFFGGAKATETTELEPLRGRDVVLWRDSDDAGLQWENATVQAAFRAGAASVTIVNPERIPVELITRVPENKRQKFDIVDLLEAGLSPAQIYEVAKTVSEPAKKPSEPSSPTPLNPATPAPAPYPIDALGSVLAPAARAIAAKVQCPDAMAAQSVLSVAALAVQAHCDVRLPFGQSRPTSLFFLTIAASGDRKSSADAEAMRPVKLREETLSMEYRPRREQYLVERDIWHAKKASIEQKAKKSGCDVREELSALGREPEEPIRPYLTLGESTAEGLAKHMPILPGALGLFSAEAGQFLAGYGFSDDAKLRTAASFSGLWDGEGLRRLRAGEGLISLRGRRLSAHLMIQPEAASTVLGDPVLRDQGLLSRILVAAPESLAGSRMWKDPDPRDEGAILRYCSRLQKIFEMPVAASNSAGNELTPRVLELSSEARDCWVKFHDAVEGSMRPGGPLAGLRDVAGKAAEHAARVAGVLQIVDNPNSTEVSLDAMARACELMDWYLLEAIRLSMHAALPAEVRDAVKLLKWIEERGLQTVSAAELQKSGPGHLRRKAALEPAIGVLVDNGWLIPGVSSGRSWRVAKAQS